MRDNKEDGPRETGSVHQQPDDVVAPAPSGLGPRGPLDTASEGGLRPVSADMQQFIGRQLRAVFDDVAKQPVPDRFLELMRQLDTKTGVR